MRKQFDNLSIGLAADQPPANLPDGAFTEGRNWRFRDGSAEVIRGHEIPVGWGNLSVTAIWACPVSSEGSDLWVYASENVVYATDGSTTAEITSATASLSAGLDLGLNGGEYNGFVLINDSSVSPRYWDPSDLSNKTHTIPNWPGQLRAKVIVPFKQFIFALRCEESAGAGFDGTLVRWSASAQPRNMPPSWDWTDPTNDAGRTTLGQTSDEIIDGLPLRDNLIIYKRAHTWAASSVGGKNVFGFRQIFGEIGMLSEQCAIEFFGKHLVATQADIVVHDGNEAQSILDDRYRSWLFGRIDTTYYQRSFMALDWRNREILFCYPESGTDYPQSALVWNWQENKLYPRELGGRMTYGRHGFLPSNATGDVIDDVSQTIDSLTGPPDLLQYDRTYPPLILFSASTPKAYQTDRTGQFNGVSKTAYLQRSALPLTRDLNRMTKVLAVLPKVIGTIGDTLKIYIGTRTVYGDSTVWSGPYTFTIGSDYKIDCAVTARIIDLKFEYTGSLQPRMFGFDVEFFPDGYR